MALRWDPDGLGTVLLREKVTFWSQYASSSVENRAMFFSMGHGDEVTVVPGLVWLWDLRSPFGMSAVAEKHVP